MKSITDAATDGMGLDYVKEQWELINKEADMYLDKINGAYEIGKLESKMLKALDNTTLAVFLPTPGKLSKKFLSLGT